MSKKKKREIQKQLLIKEKEELLKQDSKDKKNLERNFAKEEKSFSSLGSYSDFFLKLENHGFVWYRDFPKVDEVMEYYFNNSFLAPHPINDYGKFSIKELAVLIKNLYSHQRQEDYKVVVFGGLKKDNLSLLEGDFLGLRAKVFFVIGNDRTLAKYLSYDHFFFEDGRGIDTLGEKTASLVVLPAFEGTVLNTLGINCSCLEKRAGIYYYDYVNDCHETAKFLETTNIFSDCTYKKISGYRGIWDTLSFYVHNDDRFLGEILISIAMYKARYNIRELKASDYQYIFNKLYNDNSINIEKEVALGIPKTLKYVPRS